MLWSKLPLLKILIAFVLGILLADQLVIPRLWVDLLALFALLLVLCEKLLAKTVIPISIAYHFCFLFIGFELCNLQLQKDQAYYVHSLVV